MMHVIAHHRIADPERFAALAEAPAPDRPAHWRLVACAPVRGGSACFSLWWADSAADLERFLRRTGRRRGVRRVSRGGRGERDGPGGGARYPDLTFPAARRRRISPYPGSRP